jgi:hypothetical protein
MPFNQIDINNLLTIIINTNRNNPLNASQIETELHNQFNFPISGNQQRTRALIKYAIANGYLIKSSTANPSGFWLSNDRQEILINFDSLKNRAFKIMESAVRLKDTWNRNNPNNQI